MDGMTFNRQSWTDQDQEEEGKRATSSTPLLGKSSSEERGSGLGERGRGHDPAINTSFSNLLESGERKPGLFVNRTVFGEVRTCHRLSCVEWVFIAVATFTIAGVAAVSIERFIFIHNGFGNFSCIDNSNMSDFGLGSGSGEGSGGASSCTQCNHWSCLNDFTFAVLVLVNWLFCIYYCYDGLLRERPFEIIGYALTIVIIFTHVFVDYFVEGEQGDVGKLIRLVLALVLGPVNIVLSLVVQHYMGFLVLHTIGSNQQLTRAYQSRSLFLTLQTFNVQILANILVLSWVKAGHFSNLWEKIALPMLIVYIIVISYVGWAAVLWEIKLLAVMWIFLALISFGYYIFKIISIGVHWSHYKEVYIEYYVNGRPSETTTHFIYVGIVILFSCALGLVSGVVMAAVMVIVLGNFDKGLRKRIPPPCCTGEPKDPSLEHTDDT